MLDLLDPSTSDVRPVRGSPGRTCVACTDVGRETVLRSPAQLVPSLIACRRHLQSAACPPSASHTGCVSLRRSDHGPSDDQLETGCASPGEADIAFSTSMVAA